MERYVYEHVALPGILIPYPRFLVYIYKESKQLGAYGFDACSFYDLQTGVLCRACEQLKCSMVDAALSECEVFVFDTEKEGVCSELIYDADKFIFVPVKKRKGQNSDA